MDRADGALNQIWKQWTPERALEAMDKSGTQAAMLTIATPGIWFGEGYGNGLQSRSSGGDVNAAANKLARETNEYAAKLVSQHKGRFGLFAALAMPDVEGSLKEIEYAFDTLKADGIGLITSYGNRWLGDPVFTPITWTGSRTRGCSPRRSCGRSTGRTSRNCCRGLPRFGK